MQPKTSIQNKYPSLKPSVNSTSTPNLANPLSYQDDQVLYDVGIRRDSDLQDQIRDNSTARSPSPLQQQQMSNRLIMQRSEPSAGLMNTLNVSSLHVILTKS